MAPPRRQVRPRGARRPSRPKIHCDRPRRTSRRLQQHDRGGLTAKRAPTLNRVGVRTGFGRGSRARAPVDPVRRTGHRRRRCAAEGHGAPGLQRFRGLVKGPALRSGGGKTAKPPSLQAAGLEEFSSVKKTTPQGATTCRPPEKGEGLVWPEIWDRIGRHPAARWAELFLKGKRLPSPEKCANLASLVSARGEQAAAVAIKHSEYLLPAAREAEGRAALLYGLAREAVFSANLITRRRPRLLRRHGRGALCGLPRRLALEQRRLPPRFAGVAGTGRASRSAHAPLSRGTAPPRDIPELPGAPGRHRHPFRRASWRKAGFIRDATRPPCHRRASLASRPTRRPPNGQMF